MAASDGDFLRLGRNYITFTNPPLPEVAERRQYALQAFTESSNPNSEDTRRVFVRPITSTLLRLDYDNPFPRHLLRRYLKLEPTSLIRSVFRDSILPSGSSCGSLSTYKSSYSSSSSSSTPPIVSNDSVKRSKIEPHPYPSHHNNCTNVSATTNSAPKNTCRSIRQAIFTESNHTPIPGNIINGDWTADGLFAVICCKQGVLLGDVATMAFVASVPGSFTRIACHPRIPTVFAGLINANSLVVYEICERPTTKLGRSSYAMKITAEMKFTSVKLSDLVLEWSPSGTLLAVCNNDRGLYILAFEDISPSFSNQSLRPNGRPNRIRRALRIVAQRKFDSKIISTQFLNPLSMDYKDRTTAANLMHVSYQIDLIQSDHTANDDVSSQNELLYCVTELGQVLVCEYEKTKEAEKGTVNHNSFVYTGNEIVSLAVDPASGRYLALGGEDDTLMILDTETQVTLGTHYRVSGPVKHVALSSGGVLIAWGATQINPNNTSRTVLQDLDSRPATKPFVAISILNPLDLIWKMTIPAPLLSLKWHPWLPVLLILYESDDFIKHNTSSSWSTVQADGTAPPTQGIMLLHFE